MDPDDLIDLSALLASGKPPPGPPPQDQRAMLADALAAYGDSGPAHEGAADQPPYLAWALANYAPSGGDPATSPSYVPAYSDASAGSDVSAQAPDTGPDSGVIRLPPLALTPDSIPDLQLAPMGDTSNSAPGWPIGPSAAALRESSAPSWAGANGGSPNGANTPPGPPPTAAPAARSVGDQVTSQVLRAAQIRPEYPPRPELDPARTDVFQPGADGKLQPIPGWHTTGPFDFGAWTHDVDWGGVRDDLIDIALASAAALDPTETLALPKWLDDIVAKGAQNTKGLIHQHHAIPKFLGGRPDQETVELIKSFHEAVHNQLRSELQKGPLPPIGGRTGSTRVWTQVMNSPALGDKVIDVLREVSRDFDLEHGTRILPAFEKELPFFRRAIAARRAAAPLPKQPPSSPPSPPLN